MDLGHLDLNLLGQVASPITNHKREHHQQRGGEVNIRHETGRQVDKGLNCYAGSRAKRNSEGLLHETRCVPEQTHSHAHYFQRPVDHLHSDSSESASTA